MRQLIYSMQFKGQASPVSGSSGVLKATTRASSCSITCGESGHRLYFSTVGQGYMGPSADPGLQHGSVIWQVERGEGQFEEASGLITSNFFVSASGEVTDNHFGVIFVR